MNDDHNFDHEFLSLKQKYVEGRLDKYTFINKRHNYNKLFFDYSSELQASIIEKIEITPKGVIFTFKPFNIEIQVDNSARSAPFEILNFGGYEPEDENFIFKIIRDKDLILDFGAHIGWFSINLGKRFPNSRIHAFEPIHASFALLKTNIIRNKISNISIHNYGISCKTEEKFLYFCNEISPVASIKNLLNHNQAKKIKCAFSSLDNIAEDLKLDSLDFLKCDVEGSELLVLRGGANIITKFRPIIFMELFEGFCQKCGYSSFDVIKILKDLGYEIFQVFDGKLKIVQKNVLKDDHRFNYFFLHKKNHKNLIDLYHE